MKQKTKLNLKLKSLQAGGVVSVFAPLAIGVGINWQDYFSTKEAGISLTMGGALAVVIVVLNMIGKGKALFGSGFVVTGIVFALCVLLEPIILNLKFLTGMMLLGEGVNTALFKPMVNSTKEQLEYFKLGEAIHGKLT